MSAAGRSARGPLARGAFTAALISAHLTFGCGEKEAALVPLAAAETVAPPKSAPPLQAAPAKPAAEPSTPVAANKPAIADGAPRVYSKTRFLWIRERPDWGSPWLGYLSHGGSAKLKRTKPVFARGCEAWYEVEPRGYVCIDNKRGTLDPTDAGYLEVAGHLADYSSPTPHHYAESLGAERYVAPPAEGEQRLREPDLASHLRDIDAVRGGAPAVGPLLGVDLTPAPEDAVGFASLPAEVQAQRHNLKRDSTIAFLGEYRHGPRTFLLTADFAWVPKDRTRPYAPISFHGLVLGKDASLPLAFFRIHDRPGFRKLPDSDFVPVADGFHRLEWAHLTGRRETVRGVTYVETAKNDLWVREDDAVIPTPPAHTPWGAPMNTPAPAGGPRRTWIEVDVFGGWLIAYEDGRPVFTTLISAGRGGVATPAEDAAKTSSTPLGQFVVTGKFVTATMDGPTEVVHSDVPWVQNFSGPHSIHTAYWHDAWGERVSSGCVNVSPLDARYLFDFSEPKMPEGWHAARWDVQREPATVVVVHR